MTPDAQLVEYFDYYFARLKGTDDDLAEIASHCLEEAGPRIIPLVTRAFATESDASIRAELLHVVWMQRVAEALPLLERALEDQEPIVWNEAIDGLVALATHSRVGPQATAVLRRARETHTNKKDQRSKLSYHEWIDDGLQQIERDGEYKSASE